MRAFSILLSAAICVGLLTGCAVADLIATDIPRIEVGECFDTAVESGSEEQVKSGDVPVVDCDGPHDSEAYHTFDLPDGEYPGREDVYQQAEAPCIEAFEEFIGIPYADSQYALWYMAPTPESWKSDDRTVVCFVGDADGAKVTGTLRGTER